jgi:hypothetical protein
MVSTTLGWLSMKPENNKTQKILHTFWCLTARLWRKLRTFHRLCTRAMCRINRWHTWKCRITAASVSQSEAWAEEPGDIRSETTAAVGKAHGENGGASEDTANMHACELGSIQLFNLTVWCMVQLIGMLQDPKYWFVMFFSSLS